MRGRTRAEKLLDATQPVRDSVDVQLQEVIRRPAAAPKLMEDFQRTAGRAFNR